MSKDFKCPDCGEIMGKWFVRCDDDSGWMGGWSCGCKLSKEKEEDLNSDPDITWIKYKEKHTVSVVEELISSIIGAETDGEVVSMVCKYHITQLERALGNASYEYEALNFILRFCKLMLDNDNRMVLTELSETVLEPLKGKDEQPVGQNKETT